jgi:phospholipase D1/2
MPELTSRSAASQRTGEGSPPRLRLALGVVALVLLLTLTAAWRWTPLSEYLEPAELLRLADEFRAMPASPLVAVLVFALAGLLAFPVTLLIALAAVAFGPLGGIACSAVGALASAMATYAVGASLGADAVRRLAGRRLDGIARRLASSGLLAVALTRMLPVAPFAVVNLVAGALRIRPRDFALGTAIGMAPGILLITFFTDQVRAALAGPAAGRLAGTVVAAAAVVLAAIGLARWVLARSRRRAGPRPAGPGGGAQVRWRD